MAVGIVSYNLNGIRSAATKGLEDWVRAGQYDILCFQETKAEKDQFDGSALEAMGYHGYWHSAEKKGYSGVAIYTKIKPDQVIAGCGMEKYDREGRILRADFGDWTLLNCYFPSGTTGDERQAFKMEFLEDFFQWVQELRRERPKLVVVGDYNIAHHPIDIHDPVGNKKSSGFLPEERAWMTRWFESGFTDAFRHLHPEAVSYSWWSFRAGSRARNKGWRIDYQSVTDNLRGQIRQAAQLPDAVHSDHCPVWVELEVH
ncbi:MAG TPA: exodeoxyribonuclease III [Saprospiraceae bacterium]|nr:exodeoxyribonuclease III [Saprospiraceae bacterium]